MRRDGIPYVKNPQGYYPPIDYKKLSLKELTDKFIATCAKAGGKVSVCSLCNNPCEYGKRAVQLVANQVYNDPPVPLYGGKTLIERAKEENKARREKEELKKTEEKMTLKKEERKKRTYLRGEEWWDASLEYGDQIEYLKKEYGFSQSKARQAVYGYKARHGMLEPKEGPTVKVETAEVKHEDIQPEQKTEQKVDVVMLTMEQKLSELMKLQEEYKANADKYTKLYNETKEQVDVLCKAMEMFT